MKDEHGAEFGWFAFGQAGRVARWDGAAWTGEQAADAGVPEPPARRRSLRHLLTRQWLWLVLAGWLISTACGVAGTAAHSWLWALPAAIGIAVVMVGVLLLLEPLVRFTELPRLGRTVALGSVSGVVAISLASVVEGVLEPRLDVPFAADLWLSGPVEETCKLLVPVVLLVVARPMFGDPRRGVLLVLISGAVFGVGESIQYIGPGDGTNSQLLQAATRPFAEMGHPLWTGIAASAIWLGAHRAGRVVTLAGFLGWLTAAGLHSIHDGLGSFRQHGSANTITETDYTTTQVVGYAVGLNIFSILVAVVSFLVLRHVLRELVPPTAVPDNPPRWRPRLRLWGVPASIRRGWTSETGSDVPTPAP